MPPPFTFLKNFHNHDGKPPAIPPAPAEAATDKTHKIRRKLTKSAKGQTHHQVPHVPTTARAEDPRTFHQRHENRAVSPTQSSPTRSHHGTTQNRVLEMHHHTSSLASHSTHHNQHEVDHQAISVIPQGTPVAGQYMSSVHRYPQVPAAIPIVPSRSWSPIPSVHRESIRDSELDMSGFYGSEGRSWVNHVHHAVPELDFYNVHDAGEIRKESNIAAQDRTYIDYSMGRISKTESQKSFSNLKQQDENVVRRQLFQWNDRPPETIEPAIREHEISSDGDSEPEIYHYIVPAGLNVVFQDEEGNEITRVGKRGRQGQGSHTGRSAPIVVHDEFGKELYRDPSPMSTRDPTYKHGRLRNGPYISRKETKENTVLPDSGEIHPQPWLSSPASRTSSKSTKTILIDERGNQIPIKSPSVHQDTHRRLQHSPFRNVSHHGEIEHM